MHKRPNVIAEPPAGNDIVRMPRPPTRPQPTTTPHTEAAANAAANAISSRHPILVHHDRLSAAHIDYVRVQQRMHLEFLAHRERLLAWLNEAGRHLSEPTASAPLSETISETCSDPPPLATKATLNTMRAAAATKGARTPTRTITHEATLGWDDPILDSHVVPIGVSFAPLASLVTLGGNEPEIIDCTMRALGHLAAPDERVVTELAVTTDTRGSGAAGEVEFSLHASVDEVAGQRPLIEIVGRISRCDPASDAAPFRTRAARVSLAPPVAPAPPVAQAPRRWTTKRTFNEGDLTALAAGDALSAFGAGFERAASHTRTPPLPGLALVRLTAVTALDPVGGPWALGTLGARVSPGVGDTTAADDAGLRLGRLVQGAHQALAFFVAAAGATIARDGWRFEAPEGHTSRLRFFGAPRLDAPLAYEVAVESLSEPPWSTIVGDVKVWADDELVLDAERVALQLVADFPLTSDRALYADGQADRDGGRHAAEIDGFRLDYASMVAGAVGRPTDAFNQAGAFFETGERQMPRLPGPPYHFVTRVIHVAGERLSMRPGAEATMEYDAPVDAWYFDENGNRSMPWCVLLEAALQPCGWLSVYVGCPIVATENVFFRNLDGAGKMTGEVFPGDRVRTHTRVTSVSSVSGIILVSYKIECFVEDREVCNLTAAFGYFPNAALDAQGGLPTKPEQRDRLVAESPAQFDLTSRPEKYCSGALRLPGPMLLMIDRVTGFWRDEGPAGKGRLRVEKTVKPREWYFKSHFYSDPVQPGSLGVEMMLQALQFYVIEENLHAGIEQPYFEPLALDHPISWKFRGQVRPENKHIVSEVDVASVERTADGVTVVANGSLWVDGVRCYEAKTFGVRVRGGRAVAALPPRVVDSVLDPAVDAWVTDHRPSYTVPVMPMMGMVDRLAAAALDHVRASYPDHRHAVDGSSWVVAATRDIRALGWLVCDRPKNLRTEVRTVLSRAVHRTEEVDVVASLYEVTEPGAQAKRVASGTIRLARRFARAPAAWPPLEDGAAAASPYRAGSIFWGPKLQVLRRLSIGGRGLSADLDAAGADAPIGAIHPILLDGALHGVPHDELERWSDRISPGHMGVPVRLTAEFFGPPPENGIVRAEVRFAGFDGAHVFPTYLIQMIDPRGRVWAVLRHVEMLIPFGHRALTKADRIPFLVERRFKPKTGLSEFHSDRTTLRATDVKRMDGLPGSVAHVYGLERDVPIDLRIVAIKDHVAQLAKVHPQHVHVHAALGEAWSDTEPTQRYRVTVEQDGSDVVVRDRA